LTRLEMDLTTVQETSGITWLTAQPATTMGESKECLHSMHYGMNETVYTSLICKCKMVEDYSFQNMHKELQKRRVKVTINFEVLKPDTTLFRETYANEETGDDWPARFITILTRA